MQFYVYRVSLFLLEKRNVHLIFHYEVSYHRDMKIMWDKLILSICVSLLAGAIGSFFTVSSIPTWYEGLIKPTFTPPNAIFGPVWTFLYVLIGCALYLIWNSKSKKVWKKQAYLLFFSQLILNTLWSIIFFGLKSPELAIAIILLLWGNILLCITLYYKISKVASLLFVPYLLWVSFATVLNIAIAQLN